MSEKFEIKLPVDILELTGLELKTLERKNHLIWVLELDSEGKITLSKAANLLGMKIDEFLSEFHKRHLIHNGGPQSISEAEDDLSVINKIRMKR